MRDLRCVFVFFSVYPLRSIMAILRHLQEFIIRQLTHCEQFGWGTDWGHNQT